MLLQCALGRGTCPCHICYKMMTMKSSSARQIAALPYRSSGSSGAAVSILLVTSRETRRWVLPKGNRPAKLSPHKAAAMEAEEEAGVRGAIGSKRLGSYRYHKRQPGGGADLLAVDVYPLAVEQELASWKEADERERQWFSLDDAADAVEEPDLAQLIRSFRADGKSKRRFA
jgi:8-oxo-dGTP pyrophosphatase MutT (NUDIX family)